MRLISYLVLTIISLSVFNQANGSSEHRFFLVNENIEAAVPISEQDDLMSHVPMMDLFHFFHRSGKVYSKQPGHGSGGVLFVPKGREIKMPVNPIFIGQHCTPVSMLLIFPKHYFF